MKKQNFFSRLFNDESNPERLFFLFLTLILVGMYIWALTDSPALDSVWKVVLFTALMNVHIALYWVAPWVYNHPRWLVPYLAAQGLVALSIGLLVRVVGITFGLYPGLIGLVIGMPTRRAWRALAVSAFIGLSLLNYVLINGAGGALWWVLGTIPVVLFVIMYVLLYLRQAEAREKAQKLLQDLEAANRQLSEYAARVEDLTIASERQRMARDLHDTLSQGLAGVILQLEAVDAHLAGQRADRARSILQQTMERARTTLAEARRAIDDLRQPAPPDLESAVRGEAGHFSDSTGIPCDLELGALPALPEGVSDAARRAVAEALTNIARHARAEHARLRITDIAEENEFEIVVADDGVGFDPDAVEAGHYGILGMRERARLAGGRLEVRSQPGQGTQIVIRFPLADGGAPPPGAE
jgi:NarL family two-component system sensor histidine kinase YdfH